MSTFLLEIITPEKIVFSDQVDMITAPSADGIIGILPHHVPLFTRIIEGEIEIKKNSQESYLAIGGGFLEVTPKKTVLLVTTAIHANEINEQEIIMAAKRAQEALAAKPTGDALIAIEAAIRRSEIAMKVFHRRKAGRSNLPS